MNQATLDKRKQKLRELVEALPESVITGENHLKFEVRRKSFGYFLNDHHGDGYVAVCCKAAPGVMHELVEADPERYYVPAYLGAKGWIALRIDLAKLDWSEVAELVEEAYCLTAPKKLREQLESIKRKERR